jgi:hypothetical protein
MAEDGGVGGPGRSRGSTPTHSRGHSRQMSTELTVDSSVMLTGELSPALRAINATQVSQRPFLSFCLRAEILDRLGLLLPRHRTFAD